MQSTAQKLSKELIFEKNTKIAGICNITSVRHSHGPVALSESEDEITENKTVFLNISGLAFIVMTMPMLLQYTTLDFLSSHKDH